LGRLYAAGIFADFGTIAARACGTRAFIGSTARTAATTAHLSAAVQYLRLKESTKALPRVEIQL
jgi:hypothetical protein